MKFGLVLRAGKGAIFIIRNDRNGALTIVYAQDHPGSGISDYDLRSLTIVLSLSIGTPAARRITLRFPARVQAHSR